MDQVGTHRNAEVVPEPGSSLAGLEGPYEAEDPVAVAALVGEGRVLGLPGRRCRT